MKVFSWKFIRKAEDFKPFLKVIGEAAEAGHEVGKTAAEFQRTEGFLGQRGGYGGGPYTPEGIRQEQEMFTFTPASRVI
jgi:hypothetical protein|tara:strand:+ start:906 stop:1142 length:237 start_codon:yes stop_codon:yes gene_type:complete